ncbi:MAG: hypothetical protein K2N36_02285 [Ruminiclostridium sp.]|nr:hypothetical protein [Ruminiclostridium sp.]
MPENKGITTGIDVEAAISEIAEREVSEALESVTGTTEENVTESKFNSGSVVFETESITAAVTAMSEITEQNTEIVTEEPVTFVSSLPPETTAVFTEAETEAITAIVYEPVPSGSEFNISLSPERIIMPAVMIVLVIAAFALKKSVSGRSDSKKYAKDRDAQRLEADKSKESKKKGSKDNSEKEKRNL